ncbi:hypothetical protein ABKN59_004240 [Abortiporus biennis]
MSPPRPGYKVPMQDDTNSFTSTVQELPSEILLQILEQMDYHELILISYVSLSISLSESVKRIQLQSSLRFIRDLLIVKNYQAAVAGLELGPAARQYPVLHKSELLNRFRSAWEFPYSDNFIAHSLFLKTPNEPGHPPQFDQGILAHILAGFRDIEFISFYSSLNQIEEKRWTFHFHFDIKHFYICSSQDLLILVQQPDQPNSRENFYVRYHHMSTGRPHKNACHTIGPTIPIDIRLSAPRCTVYGDTIAMLIPRWRDSPLIQLWNWKSGLNHLNIRNAIKRRNSSQPNNYWDLCFLDADHILLSNSCAGVEDSHDIATLDIVDIRKGDRAVVNALHFYLPDLSPGTTIRNISITTSPSHSGVSGSLSSSSSYIFQTNNKSSFIAIGMNFLSRGVPDYATYETEYDSSSFQIFVRKSTLVRLYHEWVLSQPHFSSHSQTRLRFGSIPWQSWGPRYTRILELPSPVEGWALYGSRIVGIGHEYLWFCDFNIHPGIPDERPHFDVGSLDELPRPRSRLVRSPSFSNNKSFRDEVVTNLPFYSISTNIRHGAGRYGKVIFVGECTVLVFVSHGLLGSQKVDVYTLQF